MDITLKILKIVLNVYLILIMGSVVISWLPSRYTILNSFYIFLKRITDPYLNLFKIRAFALDFSPLLGIIFLQFALSLLTYFITYKKISLGILFAYLLNFIVGALNFFLFAAIIFVVFRFFLLIFKTEGNLSNSIDSIIYRAIYDFWGFFFKMRIIRYSVLLVMTFLFLLSLLLINNYVVGVIVIKKLMALPF